LDPERDPWDLAIVQRDRVWDHVHVARLLDSLLVGYPIGSILLCRLRDAPSPTVPALDREHRVRDVLASDWQLLDGQQRTNALTTLFSDVSEQGTYYLNLVEERPPEEELAARRRQRVAATAYIAFRDQALTEEQAPITGRGIHLCLAGLARWIGDADERPLAALRRLSGLSEGNPGRLVSTALNRLAKEPNAAELRAALDFIPEIDPECRVSELGSVTDSKMPAVAARVTRLLGVWFAQIPVERRELDSEYDILQVFQRINLAGVQVAGEDVFFAAVKTRWPAADQSLREFTSRVPVVGHRRNALRLSSHLASISESRGDLLPLRVDRLNPTGGGHELRVRIVSILQSESTAARRMSYISDRLTAASGLGFALRDSIPNVLIDPVLAWAAVNRRVDEDGWLDEHLADAAAFLLGATAFGHWNVFRVPFAIMALAEAVDAGLGGHAFPAAAIAAAARERWGISRNLRLVRGHATEVDQLAVINSNVRLFLAIVQELPFVLPQRTRDGLGLLKQDRRVEWDHIWPQDQRSRFRYSRRFAAGSDRVGNAGNFWALDAPLNNYARAQLPVRKLSFLGEPTSVPGMPDLWPAESDRSSTRWRRRHNGLRQASPS
jgi:hypothetical protein